jgi:predicted ester cyclase
VIDELVAEEFVDHVEVAGLAGTGRDRYRASVEMMRKAWPDFRNPIDFAIAENDLVVSCGRMTGTNTGELMGLPPAGRRIDLPTIGVLRIAAGRRLPARRAWPTSSSPSC